MKSLAEYLAEEEVVSTPEALQKHLEDMIARVSNMETYELEDSKPQLIELKELLVKKLSGAI